MIPPSKSRVSVGPGDSKPVPWGCLWPSSFLDGLGWVLLLHLYLSQGYSPGLLLFQPIFSPLDSGAGKAAQLLAGKVKEVDALAMGFPNISSNISGEDGVEPLQNGVGEEAEERMEESLREVEKAAEAQGSARAEELEGHIEVTEAEGSWGAIEAKEPEGSSGDEDTSGRTGKGPSAGIRGWVGKGQLCPWPWRRGLPGLCFWAQVVLGQGNSERPLAWLELDGALEEQDKEAVGLQG